MPLLKIIINVPNTLAFSILCSDASHRPLIDPSEVAIIESMMNGGRELSFKAHFISQLPDLSPLSHTLTHINLSFNNFTVSVAMHSTYTILALLLKTLVAQHVDLSVLQVATAHYCSMYLYKEFTMAYFTFTTLIIKHEVPNPDKQFSYVY